MQNLVARAVNAFRKSPDVLRAGHPTLRVKSTPVELSKIKTENVQNVISSMRKVFNSPFYNVVGLAAPQIGHNIRVIAYEIKTASVKTAMTINPLGIKDTKAVPLTFIINPSYTPLTELYGERYKTQNTQHEHKPHTIPITLQQQRHQQHDHHSTEQPAKPNVLAETNTQSDTAGGQNLPELSRSAFSLDYESCECVPTYNAVVRRCDQILVKGYDINGKKLSFFSEGLESRIIQHEVDHLDGVLFTDKMEGTTLRHEKYNGVYQTNSRTLANK